jgi:hypothetical protein
MSYHLEGDLLEVWTCQILCPCWLGQVPDGDGTCKSIKTWHVTKAQVDGVDVSSTYHRRGQSHSWQSA